MVLLNVRCDDLQRGYDRIYKIATGSIAVFILFTGWILQAKTDFDLKKSIFLCLILIIFWITTILTINDLRKSLYSSHRILVRIEQALLLYESGEYHPDGASLMPEGWQKGYYKKHFKKLKLLVSFIAGASLFFILASFSFA